MAPQTVFLATLAVLVGFQTRLRIPEQKRVFMSIPGLGGAEFLRFGSIHRNSYVNAPASLGPALRVRDGFAAFDADRLFVLPGARIEDPKACRCGDVLTGRIKPWECGVFGTACTPERPLGTCMVSSEGACAAFFSYGRLRRPREEVPVGG